MDRTQAAPGLKPATDLARWFESGSTEQLLPVSGGAEGPPIISEFVELRVTGVNTFRINGSFRLGVDVVSDTGEVRDSFTFRAFHTGSPCDDIRDLPDYTFSQIIPASSFQPGDRLYFRMYVPPVRSGGEERLVTDFGAPTASIRLMVH
jgi:hypothetical protein